MICSNYGKEMAEDQAICPSCGAEVGAAGETPPAIPSAKSNVQTSTLPGAVSMSLLAIVVGGVLMLIAMALDFYSLRLTGEESYYPFGLDFSTLSNTYLMRVMGFGNLNWAGAWLPLVCIMVFALVTVLFAAYSLVSGRIYRRLYIWLGFLSAAALIANFLYVLVYMLKFDDYGDDITFYITPHAGCGLVIVGIIVIIIGSWKLKTDIK